MITRQNSKKQLVEEFILDESHITIDGSKKNKDDTLKNYYNSI